MASYTHAVPVEYLERVIQDAKATHVFITADGDGRLSIHADEVTDDEALAKCFATDLTVTEKLRISRHWAPIRRWKEFIHG